MCAANESSKGCSAVGWRQKTRSPAGVRSVFLGVPASPPRPAGGLVAPRPPFPLGLEDGLSPVLRKARLATPHLEISFRLSKHGRVVRHIPWTSNPLASCLSFSLLLMPPRWHFPPRLFRRFSSLLCILFSFLSSN